MKDKFIEIFKRNVKRDGADTLLEWLEYKSDFFEAPASTRFHGAYKGGLCEHSVNVYNCLLKSSFVNTNPETFAIVSLLHDICKTNFYKTEMRNIKNKETGVWEQQPYYTIEDKFPYGHGEKSVYIISEFMKLTSEEATAIRWHMGAFDDSVKGGSFALSGAFEKYPLALELHIADMRATYHLESDKGKNEL